MIHLFYCIETALIHGDYRSIFLWTVANFFLFSSLPLFPFFRRQSLPKPCALTNERVFVPDRTRFFLFYALFLCCIRLNRILRFFVCAALNFILRHLFTYTVSFVFSFELRCCWSTRCYRRQMPVDLFRSLDFDICLVSFFFAISLPPKMCVRNSLCVHMICVFH